MPSDPNRHLPNPERDAAELADQVAAKFVGEFFNDPTREPDVIDQVLAPAIVQAGSSLMPWRQRRTDQRTANLFPNQPPPQQEQAAPKKTGKEKLRESVEGLDEEQLEVLREAIHDHDSKLYAQMGEAPNAYTDDNGVTWEWNEETMEYE
jgi:hypothetical protein